MRCCNDRTCAVLEISLVKVVVAKSCEYGEFWRSSSIWHLFKLKNIQKSPSNDIGQVLLQFDEKNLINKNKKLTVKLTCQGNFERWPNPFRPRLWPKRLDFHRVAYTIPPTVGLPIIKDDFNEFERFSKEIWGLPWQWPLLTPWLRFDAWLTFKEFSKFSVLP